MDHPDDPIDFTAFVLPERRGRYRELFASKRGRKKVTDALCHFRHFDPRCIVAIDPAHHDAASVERLLRALGVGDISPAASLVTSADSHREVSLILRGSLSKLGATL